MDTISNMLISIKNAGNAGLKSAVIPYSKLKFEIASVLKEEGFVGDVTKKSKNVKEFINIEILYKDKNSRISDVKRISKPSRRIYISAKDIRPVRYGYGISVLSTSKGIMTDKKAREKHIGGEALFNIW